MQGVLNVARGFSSWSSDAWLEIVSAGTRPSCRQPSRDEETDGSPSHDSGVGRVQDRMITRRSLRGIQLWALLVCPGVLFALVGLVMVAYEQPELPALYQTVRLDTPTSVWLSAGDHELQWRQPYRTAGPNSRDFKNVSIRAANGSDIEVESLKFYAIVNGETVMFVPLFDFAAPVDGEYVINADRDVSVSGRSVEWEAGDMVIPGPTPPPNRPLRAPGSLTLLVGLVSVSLGGGIAMFSPSTAKRSLFDG